jgi:hypothetical protein
MRNAQAKGRVPNFPAIPLPTAILQSQIPLPADRPNRLQRIDLQYISDAEATHSESLRTFFPCCQGEALQGQRSSHAVGSSSWCRRQIASLRLKIGSTER